MKPSTSAEARVSEAQDQANEFAMVLSAPQTITDLRLSRSPSGVTLISTLRDRPKRQGRMTFPQNLDKMVLSYMRVALCCCDRRMSQEFLDHSNVYAVA